MKILFTSLLVLLMCYFYIDRELYFRGKSDLKIYHPLPVKVKPAYWGSNLGDLGFALIDDFDFTVVAKGNRYMSSDVVVNEIIKYGFNKKEMIVIVTDSLKREHRLTLENGSESEILVSVDIKNENDKINWVEIRGKDKYVRQLEWIRSFIRIGLFILIIVVGYRIARILVRRKDTPTTSMAK
jgi:hypothetical protein